MAEIDLKKYLDGSDDERERLIEQALFPVRIAPGATCPQCGGVGSQLRECPKAGAAVVCVCGAVLAWTELLDLRVSTPDDLERWQKEDALLFKDLQATAKFFQFCHAADAGVCRLCGCTELDCAGCIEKTGAPCSWVEPDLCSACADKEQR
jgi:hypothetical protein